MSVCFIAVVVVSAAAGQQRDQAERQQRGDRQPPFPYM
jgi:hypothetical protein